MPRERKHIKPERERKNNYKEELNPGSKIPEQWSNGSGLYKEGTAHLKDDRGLIGRTHTVAQGKIKAWRYLGKDKYYYLGEFATGQEARRALVGN